MPEAKENNENLGAAPQQSTVDEMFSFAQRAEKYLKQAWYSLTHLEKANLELGIRLLRAGQFFDASLRFRFVLLLNKQSPIAYYLLGKSYYYNNKFAKAIPPLTKALAMKPELDEARFLLAACGAGTPISAIPPSFIIEKLDFIASRYDEFLANVSAPMMPVLREEIFKIVGENMGFNVLDLGCRGGDAAVMLRGVANAVVGVEPSLKMVALARNKRIDNLLTFNQISTKFPEDFLRECKDKFPLVISTYYMDNIGDLHGYFKAVAGVMEPGAIFAFNLGKNTGNENYIFRPNLLVFHHSGAYVRQVAEETGFKVAGYREFVYSPASTDLIYILEKK